MFYKKKWLVVQLKQPHKCFSETTFVLWRAAEMRSPYLLL